MEVLFKQYELICDGRQVLFEYCKSLRADHFTHNLETFGGKSIRYLLVHVVNTYYYWLGHFAGFDNRALFRADDFSTVSDVISIYHETDLLVFAFLEKYKPEFSGIITATVPERDFKLSLTPLELYTHVITHEYHHKGQILTMSRQLGYIPADTDIIRFAG